MRVALVTENFLPKTDGVTRTLAMLLEHLQRRGHRTLVLGPVGSPRRYAGARVHGVSGPPLPFYPELRLLLPPPSLERRLARFRPDVIHVVDPMMLGAAGVVWARRLGVPVVSSYHTNLAAYCSYFHLSALETPMWLYRRFVHSQCAVTLCPSPSTRELLIGRGFANLAIWSRGVDAALFHPSRRSDEWRKRIAGDAQRPIVLYVGRLSSEKNLRALVAARDMLTHAGAHLVMVGDGPARRELEHELAGARVTFTGYLHDTALAEAYASADLFAFPSLTETYGQVVTEALASGVPVVAFAAEGVRDLVRNGQTGLLVRSGGHEAFADAIRSLLDDTERRARFGRTARADAEERTWERTMDDLLDVYREVVAGQTAAAA